MNHQKRYAPETRIRKLINHGHLQFLKTIADIELGKKVYHTLPLAILTHQRNLKSLFLCIDQELGDLIEEFKIRL